MTSLSPRSDLGPWANFSVPTFSPSFPSNGLVCAGFIQALEGRRAARDVEDFGNGCAALPVIRPSLPLRMRIPMRIGLRSSVSV